MYLYNQSILREMILMLQWIQNKVNKNCRTVIKTPPAIEHSLQNTFVPVATIIGSFFSFFVQLYIKCLNLFISFHNYNPLLKKKNGTHVDQLFAKGINMYLIWASAVLVPYWFLLSQFGGFDETLCIYFINV